MRVEKADDGKKTPDLFCVRLFASDSPVANDTSDYPNPCHHPALRNSLRSLPWPVKKLKNFGRLKQNNGYHVSCMALSHY